MFKQFIDICTKGVHRYQAWLRRVHQWLEDHFRLRKFLLPAIILGIMIGLVINTRMVPKITRFPDSALGTAQQVGGQNGAANITLQSRQYNQNQQFMVISMSLSGTTAQVVDPEFIHFKVSTMVPQDVRYELLPLANNNFILVLKHLKPGYQGIQIIVTSKQPNIQALQQQASSQSSGAESSSSSSYKPAVASSKATFVINERKGFIDNKLQARSRTDYAVDSLKKSIVGERKSIKQQDKLIAAYKNQIIADRHEEDSAAQDSQYQVSDSSTAASSDPGADIKTQKGSIKDAQKTQKTSRHQIKLYEKQIDDVRSGKYKFGSDVSASTVK